MFGVKPLTLHSALLLLTIGGAVEAVIWFHTMEPLPLSVALLCLTASWFEREVRKLMETKTRTKTLWVMFFLTVWSFIMLFHQMTGEMASFHLPLATACLVVNCIVSHREHINLTAEKRDYRIVLWAVGIVFAIVPFLSRHWFFEGVTPVFACSLIVLFCDALCRHTALLIELYLDEYVPEPGI